MNMTGYSNQIMSSVEGNATPQIMNDQFNNILTPKNLAQSRLKTQHKQARSFKESGPVYQNKLNASLSNLVGYH